jgi:hypothetical protein
LKISSKSTCVAPRPSATGIFWVTTPITGKKYSVIHFRAGRFREPTGAFRSPSPVFDSVRGIWRFVRAFFTPCGQSARPCARFPFCAEGLSPRAGQLPVRAEDFGLRAGVFEIRAGNNPNRVAIEPVAVAERRPKIARSFNCGWSCPKPVKPRLGGRRMAKDSVVPPGLGFIGRAKPAVETAGYCQPRCRRWGWPVWPPARTAGKGSRRATTW